MYASIVVSPRLSKPDSTLTITFIVVFLLVISLKIIGVAAQRKWGYLGKTNEYENSAIKLKKQTNEINNTDTLLKIF